MNASTRHRAFAKATASVAGLVVLLAIASTATTAPPVGSPNANPGILPPHAKAYGKTIGEWGARWWQWALSLPVDTNPVLDPSGAYCGEGQQGPVWFIGTFGSAEKFCTMPKGKAVFMPVYNWIFGSAVFDCDPTVPGVPCVVEELQAMAAAAVEAAEVLEVTIDGVPVQDVRDYRAWSPDPFTIFLPENNVIEFFFGVPVPSGLYSPHVCDGYWLMLAPMSPGEHTLEVYVSAPAVQFEVEFTMHLTVE